MVVIASQITSLTIVYSTVYSGADQRKHQSSASLASVRIIHRWPVNSPHKRASNAENISIWWRHHVQHTQRTHCSDVTWTSLRLKWPPTFLFIILQSFTTKKHRSCAILWKELPWHGIGMMQYIFLRKACWSFVLFEDSVWIITGTTPNIPQGYQVQIKTFLSRSMAVMHHYVHRYFHNYFMIHLTYVIIILESNIDMFIYLVKRWFRNAMAILTCIQIQFQKN